MMDDEYISTYLFEEGWESADTLAKIAPNKWSAIPLAHGPSDDSTRDVLENHSAIKLFQATKTIEKTVRRPIHD